MSCQVFAPNAGMEKKCLPHVEKNISEIIFLTSRSVSKNPCVLQTIAVAGVQERSIPAERSIANTDMLRDVIPKTAFSSRPRFILIMVLQVFTCIMM